ncbi:MAG: AMIN domain-containing protein [Proteobacteria bacterium]|nr:AMIN domain-containing protein [Pseudomonadota bacterium]
MRPLAAFTVVLALGLVAPLPARAAQVVDVRVGLHPTFTRIVFELDTAAAYRVEQQPGGGGAAPALVVQLQATAKPEVLRRSRGNVRAVEVTRTGQGSRATLRLRRPGLRLRELVLSNPPRIVLDVVTPKTAAEPTPPPRTAPPPKPEPKPAAQPKPAPPKPTAKPAAEPKPEPAPTPPSDPTPEVGQPAVSPDPPRPEVPAPAQPGAGRPGAIPDPASAGAEADGEPSEAVVPEPVPSEPAPPPAPQRPTPPPPATDTGIGWVAPVAGAAAAVGLALLVLVWLRRRQAGRDAELPPGSPDVETFLLEEEPIAEAAPPVSDEPAVFTEASDEEAPLFAALEKDMDSENPGTPTPTGDTSGGTPLSSAGDSEVLRLVREMERRINHLETRCDELVDARERLERQVAAQTEELRVQRAAIARTQRALRSMTRGDEEASEPAPRDPSRPSGGPSPE